MNSYRTNHPHRTTTGSLVKSLKRRSISAKRNSLKTLKERPTDNCSGSDSDNQSSAALVLGVVKKDPHKGADVAEARSQRKITAVARPRANPKPSKTNDILKTWPKTAKKKKTKQTSVYKSLPERLNDNSLKALEVRTWYSLQDEFPKSSRFIFDIPENELLSRPQEEVDAWLANVQTCWQDPSDQQVSSHEGPRTQSLDDMRNELEVMTWYSLKDNFAASKQMDNLFRIPAEERLRYPSKSIRTWLDQVKQCWDLCQRDDQAIPRQISARTPSVVTASDATVSTEFWSSVMTDVESLSDSDESFNGRELEIRMWYSLQEEYCPLDEKLFEVSADERMLQSCREQEEWLQQVQVGWDEYQRDNEEKADEFGTSDEEHAAASKNESAVRRWYAFQKGHEGLDPSLFELSVDERIKQHPEQVESWLRHVNGAWNKHQSKSDDKAERELSSVHAIEVQTWFSIQHEFQALDESLFETTAVEILRQEPSKVRAWLKEVQAAWEKYEKAHAKAKAQKEGAQQVPKNESATRPASTRSSPKRMSKLALKARSASAAASPKRIAKRGSDAATVVTTNAGSSRNFSVRFSSKANSPGRSHETSGRSSNAPRSRSFRNLFSSKSVSLSTSKKQSRRDSTKAVAKDLHKRESSRRSSKKAATSSKGNEEDETLKTELEVRTWFSLQAELGALDEKMFEKPAEEIMSQSPREIRSWLKQVQRAWNQYQKTDDELGGCASSDEDHDSEEDVSDGYDSSDSDHTSKGTDPVVNAIEIKTWFSLQEEYGVLDDDLFKVSATERLQQQPAEIKKWLGKVEAEWKSYEKSQLKGKST